MPTYAPSPRLFRKKLALVAGDEVLLFRAGAGPDEGVRVPYTDFGGGGGAGPSPGNPTASLGLAAIDGSAATFMRSDAAPALDVGIAPTWGGIHTFSATPRFKTGGYNDMSVELGAAVFGFCKYHGTSGDGILSQMGSTIIGPSFSSRGLGQTNTHLITWSLGGDPMEVADTALGRAAAGVVEINNGTPGTLATLLMSSFRFTAGSYFFSSDAAAIAGTFVNSFMGIDDNMGGLYFANTHGVVWSANVNVASFDKNVAIKWSASGVLEINDGTNGTGHGKALNFPRTAADADAPAPSSGATFYSKQVGGKNALFARFPTGAVQQLSIEP